MLQAHNADKILSYVVAVLAAAVFWLSFTRWRHCLALWSCKRFARGSISAAHQVQRLSIDGRCLDVLLPVMLLAFAVTPLQAQESIRSSFFIRIPSCVCLLPC